MGFQKNSIRFFSIQNKSILIETYFQYKMFQMIFKILTVKSDSYLYYHSNKNIIYDIFILGISYTYISITYSIRLSINYSYTISISILTKYTK